MKKLYVLFALLLAFALLFCACKKDVEQDETKPSETAAPVSETAGGTTAQDESAATEPASAVAPADGTTAPAAAPTEIPTAGDPEPLSEGQTMAVNINDYLPETADWSAADWIEFAQKMVDDGCKVYEKYLYSDDWATLDEKDKLLGGWVRVTNFDSIAAATAEFYGVFSETAFQKAFDGRLTEKNGKLYLKKAAAHTKDAAFDRLQVASLDDIGDGTIFFTAMKVFTDGRYEETKVQLLFERGGYRLYDFTMPW
ncbi:MAG: hypothetical protein IJK02_04935 [Clostridia bacterium]|nr:hypothetical protein [Clostridia bacterium]